MRQDKKWTVIAAPKKPDPEIKYFTCKIHKGVRMVDVGENVLRCPLCGSNIISEEEKDDTFKISGVI